MTNYSVQKDGSDFYVMGEDNNSGYKFVADGPFDSHEEAQESCEFKNG